ARRFCDTLEQDGVCARIGELVASRLDEERLLAENARRRCLADDDAVGAGCLGTPDREPHPALAVGAGLFGSDGLTGLVDHGDADGGPCTRLFRLRADACLDLAAGGRAVSSAIRRHAGRLETWVARQPADRAVPEARIGRGVARPAGRRNAPAPRG